MILYISNCIKLIDDRFIPGYYVIVGENQTVNGDSTFILDRSCMGHNLRRNYVYVSGDYEFVRKNSNNKAMVIL